MKQVNELGNDIKTKLQFTGPLKKVDNILLFLAYSSYNKLKEDVKNKINQQYGVSDLEKLFFIGGGISKFIFVQILTSLCTLNRSLVLARKLKTLTNPHFYNEFLHSKGLYPPGKKCKHVFISIIGAIFVDLYYNQGLGYGSVDYINKWVKSIMSKKIKDVIDK